MRFFETLKRLKKGRCIGGICKLDLLLFITCPILCCLQDLMGDPRMWNLTLCFHLFLRTRFITMFTDGACCGFRVVSLVIRRCRLSFVRFTVKVGSLLPDLFCVCES